MLRVGQSRQFGLPNTKTLPSTDSVALQHEYWGVLEMIDRLRVEANACEYQDLRQRQPARHTRSPMTVANSLQGHERVLLLSGLRSSLLSFLFSCQLRDPGIASDLHALH